jgi:hypothetical protein
MPETAAKEELLDSLYVEASEKTLDPSLIDQPVLERLPAPAGWRILILPYRPPKATKSGILFSDKTLVMYLKWVPWLMLTRKNFQKAPGAKKNSGLSLPGMLDHALRLKVEKSDF